MNLEQLISPSVRPSGNGIHTIELDNFEKFSVLGTRDHFLNRPEFIYRGHRDPSWKLEPTLTRFLRRQKLDLPEADALAGQHLKALLYALRGSISFNSSHQQVIDEIEAKGPRIDNVYVKSTATVKHTINELWALGQHYGLLTPLLDWTFSPYAALFFAFLQPDNRKENEECRVVYALNRKLIEYKCHSTKTIPVSFIEPLTQSNARLTSQSGLFTYCPDFAPLEEWITKHFIDDESKLPVLIRILVRNRQRLDCLRWLNRMNVNSRTLFPDLEGICRFCNHSLEDPVY